MCNQHGHLVQASKFLATFSYLTTAHSHCCLPLPVEAWAWARVWVHMLHVPNSMVGPPASVRVCTHPACRLCLKEWGAKEKIKSTMTDRERDCKKKKRKSFFLAFRTKGLLFSFCTGPCKLGTSPGSVSCSMFQKHAEGWWARDCWLATPFIASG